MAIVVPTLNFGMSKPFRQLPAPELDRQGVYYPAKEMMAAGSQVGDATGGLVLFTFAPATALESAKFRWAVVEVSAKRVSATVPVIEIEISTQEIRNTIQVRYTIVDQSPATLAGVENGFTVGNRQRFGLPRHIFAPRQGVTWSISVAMTNLDTVTHEASARVLAWDIDPQNRGLIPIFPPGW